MIKKHKISKYADDTMLTFEISPNSLFAALDYFFFSSKSSVLKGKLFKNLNYLA